jgi:PAS domain S-box-containing protein
MKVIIADDNEQNLYMLEALFRGHGHQVVTVRNGSEALTRLTIDEVDLIISDILMPVMDGYQLCRAVRADDKLKNIPFVFYTATYTEAKDVEFGLSLGADRYFIKPKDPEALFEAIVELIAQRGPVAVAQKFPLGEEMEFFRQYNGVLFRKLEKKMSDLELANKALQESINHTQAILNNIPDIAWLKDTESRYLAVNEPFIVACGLSRSELAGKTDFDIWPDNLADIYRKDDAEVMHSGRPKRIEERLIDHKGKEFLIETIKSPVFDSSGTVIGTTGIARDITERKRAEEEKTKIEEQLRQSQKMEAIGHLAGGMAHDFNNILTGIIGFCSIINKRMKPDDPLKRPLAEINSLAGRAASLTHGLLAFSRKQPIEMKYVDINANVSRMEKIINRLIGEDITLKVILSTEQLTVNADSGQIDQVIINLVTNARDAMLRGGTLTIRVDKQIIDENFIRAHGYGEAGNYAVLAVSDSGTGMDEKTKEQIFEPFFTTKEVGKGTGLGLAIVYGIIKQHNGFINVYSEPNQGTTFRMYLPVATSMKMDKIVLEVPPVYSGTETILLAEDDKSVSEIIRVALEEQGYKVIEAANGEEALTLFRDNSKGIDLILSDMIMPKKNGWELYAEARQINPDVKVLFMSGYTSVDISERGLLEEGTSFISKPADPGKFLRKVREILDS